MEFTGRQNEIIAAAGKLISLSGINSLTIKNISVEMGFSEAAIYRHFKSKEEIILSMLTKLSDEMDSRFSNMNPELNAEDQFKWLFNNQFSYFKDHPFFVVVVFSDGLLEQSELINKAIFRIMQVKMKHLLPIIMKGQQDGTFTKEITTEEILHIVMGSFRLQMYKWRVSHFELDINRIGNSLIESLMILLKKQK